MIPGLRRSPGEGKGYPLHYSGLENSMDCIVHGVTESRIRPSDFHFHFLADTLTLPLSMMLQEEPVGTVSHVRSVHTGPNERCISLPSQFCRGAQLKYGRENRRKGADT